MRGILRCSAVAVMFVVGLGISSHAQSIPPGSYQQTCRNIDFHDDVLMANCQDSTGRWQSAQLRDVQSCRSDIINDDGALRCSRSGGVAAGLPGGSYTQSCQDVHAHGDDLQARCPTANGDWKDTKLDDYNKCRGEIVNDNGKLRCITGVYGGPGAPVGGYQGGYPLRLAASAARILRPARTSKAMATIWKHVARPQTAIGPTPSSTITGNAKDRSSMTMAI